MLETPERVIVSINAADFLLRACDCEDAVPTRICATLLGRKPADLSLDHGARGVTPTFDS